MKESPASHPRLRWTGRALVLAAVGGSSLGCAAEAAAPPAGGGTEVTSEELCFGCPGDEWRENPDASLAGEDAHVAGLRELGFDGTGVNVFVADDNRGFLGGHYELERSIVGDMVAPGVRVRGDTRCLHLKLCKAPARVAENGVARLSGGGVIVWVMPLWGRAEEEVLEVLEILSEHADAGGVTVMGAGVFDVEHLRSDAVREALGAAEVVVVDCPKRGETLGSVVEANGPTAEWGTGEAVTASLPTQHGWCSIATPVVGGAVALMLEGDPGMTGARVRQRLGDASRFSRTVETGDGTTVPLFHAVEATGRPTP